jgi:hypothetical protein
MRRSLGPFYFALNKLSVTGIAEHSATLKVQQTLKNVSKFSSKRYSINFFVVEMK